MRTARNKTIRNLSRDSLLILADSMVILTELGFFSERIHTLAIFFLLCALISSDNYVCEHVLIDCFHGLTYLPFVDVLSDAVF